MLVIMFSMLLYKSDWIAISLTDLYHIHILKHMHFPG